METSLNFFKEYYFDFLNENHPDYVEKNKENIEELVEEKSKDAFKLFDSLREDGTDIQQALEVTRRMLKEGFMFSRFDMVYNILEDQFTTVFEKWNDGGILKEMCIKIVFDCEDVFKKFDTSDNFVYDDNFEKSIFERIKTLRYVI